MRSQKSNSSVTLSLISIRISKYGGKLIFFTLISSALLLTKCTVNQSIADVERANILSRESSPYLLQHANNPVHWQPWGEEALKHAEENDKLLLVSIGYSACHWCHVMEHECFEDSATAELMNRNFVSIKVDREERPDVDQIYMTALQLMSGQGGWPLNVICLPDGRPVWGATYLPRDKWQQALTQLAGIYEKDSLKMIEYAEKLRTGIEQAELVQVNENIAEFTSDDARKMFNTWAGRFDTVEGGPDRAPKFPMPVNQQFLLDYGILDLNARALKHSKLTLDKMALGGIYDQVGGGFARYSTDALWTVPHFEKMLYDNAQLLSLYARAYRHYKDDTYRRVMLETIAWLDLEMTGNSGEYYSALDADSEGEEGKYYVWSLEELQALIPESQWKEFTEYFDLKKGEWENNIILTVSEAGKVDPKNLAQWRKDLYEARELRPRPGLDDKSLTSWNALMITGLIDAAKALHQSDPEIAQGMVERAEKVAAWISKDQSGKGNMLYHSSRLGKPAIEGLLEDYVFSIQASLDLFEYTGNEAYLTRSIQWLNKLDREFKDTASELYYTRSLLGEQLISRSLDRVDNVIPSPNSVMAHNLWRISHLYGDESKNAQALKMLNQISKERLIGYVESYANWGQLILRYSYPSPEVVITGKDSHQYYLELQKDLIPNTLWLWNAKNENLPLLKSRQVDGETMVYVCENQTCKLPVNTVEKAREQLINGM